MSEQKKISPPVLIYLTGCFFFSGLCGLIYQVIWTRSLSLIFGHTTFAISTVITAFMAGLALGSFILGRWSDGGGGLKKRLATFGASPLFLMYGLLEGLIGLYCLFTPLLFKGVEFTYLKFSCLSFHGMSFLRFLLCLAVLIVPTFCMGGTLPLLSRFLIRSARDIGRHLGFLYFINTLGAVAGTLLAGFLLIQNVGLQGTLQAAAVINMGIAVLVYAINRRGEALFVEPSPGESAVPVEPGEAVKMPVAGTALPVRIIVAIFALTGFASMIYELAWTRALVLALGSSTYAFSTMLATFLSGIALGSLIYSFLARKWEFSTTAFGWLELMIGISALLCIPLLGSMPLYFIKIFPYVKHSYSLILLADFMLAFVVMLVPTTLMGIIFPLVGRLYSRTVDSLGRSVGNVYAINTLGCIAGSALTGFVLIPFLGVQSSLKIAVAINVASGLLVLFLAYRQMILRLACVVSLVAFFILLRFVPPWNLAIMSSGSAIYTEQYPTMAPVLLKDESSRPIFYRDGISITVSVIKVDGDYILRVNGKTDAGTGKDMPTQLLLGYIPTLYHQNPESAYVVGLGSGITAKAVLDFPSLKTLECAEIEPAVAEANVFFAPFNGNILSNPRFRLALVDGRNGLLASPHMYDLIISQPSSPWMAGISNIFSTEFFTICKNRLKERGIMLSWISLRSMQPDDVKMVLRTFYEVYPYGTVWQSTLRNLLLIGSREPLVFDYERYVREFRENRAFRESMKGIGIDEPDALFAHYICDAADLRALLQTAEVNTDNLPSLEYRAPRNIYIDTFTANTEGLSAFKSGLIPAVKGKDLNEKLSPSFYLKLQELYQVPNPALAAVMLQKGLSSWPHDIRLVKRSVENLMEQRRSLVAERYLKELIRKYPGNAGYHGLLGFLYEMQGFMEDALASYRKSLGLDRDGKDAAIGAARVLLAQGKPDESEKTLAALPESLRGGSDVILLRADIMMARGDFAGAIPLLQDLSVEITSKLQVQKKLFRCQVACGNREKILQMAPGILAMEPSNLEVSIPYASVLAEAGKVKECRNVLLRALQNNPYNRDLVNFITN